jgi:MerR family transcriptional regulator, copper efflux regulator
MLINELSKQTGISAHTIRYYENFGLLRGKRDESVSTNKYMHYDEEAVYRLGLIQSAKAVGFTLNEIKQLIEVWSNRGFTVEQKMAILDGKLADIEAKIQQLEGIKTLIAEFKEEVRAHDC